MTIAATVLLSVIPGLNLFTRGGRSTAQKHIEIYGMINLILWKPQSVFDTYFNKVCAFVTKQGNENNYCHAESVFTFTKQTIQVTTCQNQIVTNRDKS